MGNNNDIYIDKNDDNENENYNKNEKRHFIGVSRVIILIMMIIVKKIMNKEVCEYNKVSKIKGVNK